MGKPLPAAAQSAREWPQNSWSVGVYTPFLNPWWWDHDTVWVQICYGSSWYKSNFLWSCGVRALPLKTYWLLVPG